MNFAPIFDENDDKLYTFSHHAIEQLETHAERNDITWDLIDKAINHPTETYPSPTEADERRLRVGDRWLKVVVNEERLLIVTAYWFTHQEGDEQT